MVYSTLFGGEVGDFGLAIAVDVYGNVYITGDTLSTHFPVTPNAFQSANKQRRCGESLCPTAFIAKLNPSVAGVAGLIYSSYLGGTDGGGLIGDIGYSVAVDSSGNAYVAGHTGSRNFPTTPGSFQVSPEIQCDYGFVTKLNAAGSALAYSTYITPTGLGPRSSEVLGIALDSSANAYLVGGTRSTSFPVTPNAFQSTNHGGLPLGYDAFVTELAASGSSLIYSSYLGGSGEDLATGVVIDVSGDIYLTGTTSSLNFPVTPFAYQPVYGGNGGDCNFTRCGDFFVTKFPLGAPGGLSITGMIPNAGGNAGTVTPQIVGNGFHAGATAQLDCGTTIGGTNSIVGPEGRYLNTTFDLTGVLPTTCDVLVTNPDGVSAKLSQAFTVEQGGAPIIRITKAATGAVPWLNMTYWVMIQNVGTTDATNLTVEETLEPWFTFLSSTLPPTNILYSPAVWPPSAVDSGAKYAAVVQWTVPLWVPDQLQHFSTLLGSTVRSRRTEQLTARCV